MPKLPSYAIALPQGTPPPTVCPRCAGLEPYKVPLWARKQNGWAQVAPLTQQHFADRGLRALAMCSGCMMILVEVTPT